MPELIPAAPGSPANADGSDHERPMPDYGTAPDYRNYPNMSMHFWMEAED